MAKRDIIAGLILLLLGIGVGSVALTYGYKAEYGPGPGFIPFWLSVALVVLSLFLIVQGIVEHRQGKTEVAEDQLMLTNPKVFFSALGTMFLVSVLFEHVGFVITVGLSTMVFVKLVKPDHGWGKSVLIGFTTSIVMYGFFNYLMGITLPRGVLPL